MNFKAIWKELYDRFDPNESAIDASWRADRERSPAADIVRRLGSPLGRRQFLVSGTVGTGKTTELLRVAEARSHDDFVIVLDLVRHFGEVVRDAGWASSASSTSGVFPGWSPKR